jgi:hypothetical protein
MVNESYNREGEGQRFPEKKESDPTRFLFLIKIQWTCHRLPAAGCLNLSFYLLPDQTVVAAFTGLIYSWQVYISKI